MDDVTTQDARRMVDAYVLGAATLVSAGTRIAVEKIGPEVTGKLIEANAALLAVRKALVG